MRFIQVIEYQTSRRGEVQELLRKYRTDTEGRRTTTRATICVDRDTPGRHVVVVDFPSYEAAMENSNLPETEDFAQALMAICDEPPVFRNLDVSEVLED